MLKKIIFLSVFAFLASVVTSTVLAAGNLVVRLEQPKTPTNQKNFKLNFVVLDMNNNAVTVKCFKKGPSDGSFSQFDADKILKAGGNSGYCQIDGNVLNTSGTYQFKVTGTSDVTSESSVVSVDFNNIKPGTPYNYSKEEIGSCDYKIKFHTSNNDGGKTTSVAVYRSAETSFIADNNSLIYTQSVGSDKDIEVINSVPDCNKDYYFAVRAFDSAGNGSDLTGDSNIITTTSNVINSQQGTGSQAGTSGAINAGSNSTVNPETSPTPTTGNNENGQSNSPTSPSVLGTNTDANVMWRKPWFWVAVAALVSGLYLVLRKRK